jgi:hypothetical protein
VSDRVIEMHVDRVIEMHVPTPDEYLADGHGHRTYDLAQMLVAMAVQHHGLEMGLSHALSGVTRAMRRHMSITEAQEVLRQLADTLPEAAKYDL